jgi:hypothetical protein
LDIFLVKEETNKQTKKRKKNKNKKKQKKTTKRQKHPPYGCRSVAAFVFETPSAELFGFFFFRHHGPSV